MTDPTEEEATRLAEQRNADLRNADERATAAEYLRGQKDAIDAANEKATQERFKAINGSIERTAAALQALTDEVREMKADLKERDAINLALVQANTSLGAKKLTRFQTASLVFAGLISFGSLLVAVLQAVGHG